jgi:uncharacterized protein with HEPN domain
MKREASNFIEDINAMKKALKFVEGMSYDEFAQDDKTIFAVIRAIEIIGEAVKNIPDNIKREYPKFLGRDGWNEGQSYSWIFWSRCKSCVGYG